MSQPNCRQISSASWGFAFPEKTFMPPVVLMTLPIAKTLPIADCQLPIGVLHYRLAFPFAL
jgi:hypothetical protein